MTWDSYRDQVVLITGAGSGLGRQMALELARAGARLALGDLQPAALQATVDAVRAAGAEVLSMTGDVAREADVKALVETTTARWSRLDVAVNNAGMSPPMKRLIDTEEADLDLAFAINTKGVFFGMKHQLPVMVAQGGGVILNVASMAGLRGAQGLAAYVAAKHAVIGLTRTAANEHARDGVRVNAICPYYTTTPMVTESALSSLQDTLAAGPPMRRLGHPAEVVAAMLALCLPQNSYMTGQAIPVDGGLSA